MRDFSLTKAQRTYFRSMVTETYSEIP